jgi:hypothetical protein
MWHVCTGDKTVLGFGGKPEGERPLGRPSIDGRTGSEWILGRLSRGGADWIRLAQQIGIGGKLL